MSSISLNDELHFACLYDQLKKYNKTADSATSIYYLSNDIYAVDTHRRVLLDIHDRIKGDSGTPSLSSILGTRFNVLSDQDLATIYALYEEFKIPTKISELNVEPFFEFFNIEDAREKKIFRWVVAATRLTSRDVFRNSYLSMAFRDYYGITQTIINDSYYSDGSIFKKDIFDRKDNSVWVLKPEFEKILHIPNFTLNDISSKFYRNDLKTNLRIEQFNHLAEDIDFVEKIVSKSLEEKKTGTNIMFWGMPGTGKTELAILLAKKNGWNLISVSDSEKDRAKEKSRAQRVQALTSAMKIFKDTPNAVLLFDEVEDIFKVDLYAGQSKLFINRITETSSIPIIWTTNSLHSLGRPFLRRMSYNVEFEIPDSKTRVEIWKDYLQGADESVLKSLSREYKLTPASIKIVSDAVNISGVTGYENIRKIINKTQKLLNYGEEVDVKKFKDYNNTYYDIGAANASLDLEHMKNQLLKANPNFSLCLYGPPGTGKSEYAKYLASQLGYQVLYKRASELLGMYVGETEKNIARTFKEARDEGKFIIIDEGDTFLRDRTGAHRSWEVTQVNEFLSHMEMLDVPLAITTNLFEALDAAALRRFTFKVKFDFLTEEQRTNLFKRYFNIDAPDFIKKMEILTPGDFANVKRKIDILNITDEKEILDLLNDEIKQKPQFEKESNFGFTR